MSTRESDLPLLEDDRGAIMVMGIFMCSCLVASLWYLAGLGDAILFRERLQETADAVAFSDAALHARGMNLIVLINLIMSVILSIRVALRVGKLVLAIEAIVFAALAFIPGNQAIAGVSAATGAGAVALNNIDNATKAPIDGALNALVEVEQGIAVATPIFAHAAAKLSVGAKYGGTVAITEPSLTSLPVEKGPPKVLCYRAGQVLPDLTNALFDKAGLKVVGDVAGDAFIFPLMEAMIGSDADYFCDLEAGSSKPNDDKQSKNTAEKRCQDPSTIRQNQQGNFDNSEAAWIEACANAGVRCTGKDAAGKPLPKGVQAGVARGGKKVQDDLDRRALRRNEDAAALQQLDRDPLISSPLGTAKCMQWAQADFAQRRSDTKTLDQQQSDPSDQDQNQGQDQDDSQSQGESGIAAMSVKGFENGNKEGQIFAAAINKTDQFQKDGKIVRIGTLNAKGTPALADPSNAKVPALAQAEFFFDCGDTWAGCNPKVDSFGKGDDAMWSFQWRPRLRRVNQPVQSVLQQLSLELGIAPPQQGPDDLASKVAQEALAPSTSTHPNAALRHDLANSLQDNTTHSQGVH